MNSEDISNFFAQLSQMDFGPIIRFLAPTIVYYSSYSASEHVIVNYKLKKDSKISGVKTLSLPPEAIRKYDDIKEELVLKKQYGDSIMNFINVVKDNIPEINPAILANNIYLLKIKNKDFRLINYITNNNTAGQYNHDNNTIEVSKNNYKLTIYHELFHVISTIINEETGMIYCGFNQITKNNERIGEGINEGYTQYLTEKYFGKDNTLNSYVYEKRIAKVLEIIIGKERMQSLYFNANLSGLIDYLKIYSSEEEVYNFIHQLDFLNKHIYDKHLNHSSKELLISNFKDVNSFLVRLSLRKKIKDNPGQSLNSLVNLQSIMDILTLIPTSIKTKYYIFNTSDEEQLKKDFSSVLTESNNVDNKKIELVTIKR